MMLEATQLGHQNRIDVLVLRENQSLHENDILEAAVE